MAASQMPIQLACCQWIFHELEEIFKCKSADMVIMIMMDLITQDYLGMVIRIEGDRIYMSMAKYIKNACNILNVKGESRVGCPSINPSTQTALYMCCQSRVRLDSSQPWEWLDG